jgi:hypothetical protein
VGAHHDQVGPARARLGAQGAGDVVDASAIAKMALDVWPRIGASVR